MKSVLGIILKNDLGFCSGFVSDYCLKNRIHCWPLSVNDNDARSSKDIDSKPHIDVPKFRQWQCQTCLSEIDMGGTLEDNVNTTVRCSRLLKTRSHHVHRSLENVLGHLLKKSEQHPDLGKLLDHCDAGNI